MQIKNSLNALMCILYQHTSLLIDNTQTTMFYTIFVAKLKLANYMINLVYTSLCSINAVWSKTKIYFVLKEIEARALNNN